MSQIIVKNEDKVKNINKNNVIYKAECKDCEVSYVGEIKWSFNIKKSEHFGRESSVIYKNLQDNKTLENLVAIQLNLTTINISKPIYIELATLEVSKICVYRFHYDLMKKNLGDECTIELVRLPYLKPWRLRFYEK